MSQALPPYPRFGECIAVLSGALDVKKTGSDVGRLAREGDFDSEKLDCVIQDLLVEGASWVIGDWAPRMLKPWLSGVRNRYTDLVLDVGLDRVSRKDALPILVEEFFLPLGANLFNQAARLVPGPDLDRFLDEGSIPVREVFKWLDGLANMAVEKALYPGSTGSDRVEQEKIRKWRTGVDIPSSQGIKLLGQRLQTLNSVAEPMVGATFWLAMASAIVRLERVWGQTFRVRLLELAREPSAKPKAIQFGLRDLAKKAANTCPQLVATEDWLRHELRGDLPKKSGDADRVWERVCEFEVEDKAFHTESQGSYRLEWTKGRWYVLSGKYEEALPHYERAFDLSCYRAGHQTKELLAEAIAIAAFLGKKPVLKRLKHVGISFGLFRKPESVDVLEEWEIEQLASQLPRLFPVQGRFIESAAELAMQPMAGLMLLSLETIAEIKPDLKKPDRVRAVHFASGELRRWPQLRLFASFGMLPQVKALLAAGASVDDLDSTGSSALLCALQDAQRTGARDVLDLLLARPHTPATLNAATQKKRLTPLMCAIDLGLPDVIQSLIEQTVDVEKRALTDQQTPLYYLTSQLFAVLNPNKVVEQLVQSMQQLPDLVQQDTSRRFGAGGVFGHGMASFHAGSQRVREVCKRQVAKQLGSHTPEKLMDITKHLLGAGADPNAAHDYPVRGYTPLMLAAESDMSELFALMMQYGGDPLQRDANGRDCGQIAITFGSKKVWDYLQKKAPA